MDDVEYNHQQCESRETVMNLFMQAVFTDGGWRALLVEIWPAVDNNHQQYTTIPSSTNREKRLCFGILSASIQYPTSKLPLSLVKNLPRRWWLPKKEGV